MATGVGSPCGACKFLRRKCTPDCIFAPYFSSDESPAQFAAIHKVFGASNVSKLLSQLPSHDRCEAVVTVAYEAQARLKDPVYGCVGHIFALQKQVAILQAQLMQVKAQLAYQAALSLVLDQDQSQGSAALLQSYNVDMQQMCNPKRSSVDRVEYCQGGGGLLIQQMGCYKEELASTQELFKKKAAPQNDLGELQAMAQRMMRS